jgi:hypothetical protein
VKEVDVDISLHGSVKVKVKEITYDEVSDALGEMSDKELFHTIANNGEGMDGDQIVVDTIYNLMDQHGNMESIYSLSSNIIQFHLTPYKQIINLLVDIVDSYSDVLSKRQEFKEIADNSKAVVEKVNKTLKALENRSN